jgi:hypothetical protein
MEEIMRVILACALAVILSVPAKADETVKYRYFATITTAQIHEVGDIPGHFTGWTSWSGLAEFPDGSVTPVSWGGPYDITNGNGTYISYGSVAVKDGSTLWTKTTGPAKSTDGGKTVTFPDGVVTVIKGTGRFEGAKGDGTADGARVTPPGPDGRIYGDAVINIKK